MKTLGMILSGFILMVTIAGTVSNVRAFECDDEDIVTTVFDPTDNIHQP